MFIRKKGIYYYLVNCDYKKGKRLQKVKAYLGTKEKVETLFKQFKRLSEK